ncbi:lipase [Methylophaga lonarensis MPL]|uniref:Lipase n=1 Tax=Methylophaga lonarensis MPL TaxID=1286106 RepID=M7P1C2_9GAMM|nr:DUF4389 domain-containing protein [Methylophaga lonarensis]EMR13266.1 lipase [Methylophaga lonarensis MPL]
MELQTVKQNLSRGSQWIRLLFMLAFAVVLYLLLMLLSVVVVVQLIFALFTGAANASVRTFSSKLAQYIQQIVLFLTYNIDNKPYPFSPIDAVSEVDDVIVVDDFEEVRDSDTNDDNRSTP